MIKNLKKIVTVHSVVSLVILGGSLFGLYWALPNGKMLGPEMFSQYIFSAKVLEVLSEVPNDTNLPHQSSSVQQLHVRVAIPDNPREATVMNDIINVAPGDQIYVRASGFNTPLESFDIIDVRRQGGMLVLVGFFVALVVGIGGGKGLKALIGLVATLAIVFAFIVPRILAGQDGVQVALLASLAIVVVNIYLTDGLSKKALLAIAGIFITIICTALLTKFSIVQMHFTGFSGEEALYLNEATNYSVNLIGIVMAGVIIAALGVLDDVAVTQVSVVRAIAHANPGLSQWHLFRRAMVVGRDHIAAVINTLALAYVGAALPILLLLSMEKFPIGFAVNNEMIAEEIVRTLISTTGLVLAVPITTLLATLVKHPEDAV